jgi:hypothetical protein
LKGGTALNLFYLDLARLSVDIDLSYVAHIDREAMLADRPDGNRKPLACLRNLRDSWCVFPCLDLRILLSALILASQPERFLNLRSSECSKTFRPPARCPRLIRSNAVDILGRRCYTPGEIRQFSNAYLGFWPFS